MALPFGAVLRKDDDPMRTPSEEAVPPSRSGTPDSRPKLMPGNWSRNRSGAVSGGSLPRVTSHSLAALRKYDEGRRALGINYELAVQLLNEAEELTRPLPLHQADLVHGWQLVLDLCDLIREARGLGY